MQSFSSLLKPCFLPEILGSLRKPCPSHHLPCRILPPTPPHFPLVSSFWNSMWFFSNFYLSRFLVANYRSGLWLTYPGKEFIGQIGSASQSQQETWNIMLRKISRDNWEYSQGAARGSLLGGGPWYCWPWGLIPTTATTLNSAATSEASVVIPSLCLAPSKLKTGHGWLSNWPSLVLLLKLPGRGNKGGCVKGQAGSAATQTNGGVHSRSKKMSFPNSPAASSVQIPAFPCSFKELHLIQQLFFGCTAHVWCYVRWFRNRREIYATGWLI